MNTCSQMPHAWCLGSSEHKYIKLNNDFLKSSTNVVLGVAPAVISPNQATELLATFLIRWSVLQTIFHNSVLKARNCYPMLI